MLEARNLRKSFGKLVATDDVSATFGETDGEMVFIVGPNGAGKTTFINLLTGLLTPDEGSVIVDGEDVTDVPAYKRVDKGLVRSFQVVSIFEEMTVRENLRTASLAHGKFTRNPIARSTSYDEVEAKVDSLLTRFQLDDVAETVAEQLPHGDRKLLDVGMSFAMEPKYLLLDEPTSGVSARETENVIETIASVSQEENVTTVTIEHDMDIVRGYADRLIALHQGSIHGDGPPTMLETDDELRRLLLGVKE